MSLSLTCAHAHTCTQTCTHMYTHVHTCTQTCPETCTHMLTHANTCTHMHTNMHTHAHTCTHMHTHAHTCTHMHTHAHTNLPVTLRSRAAARTSVGNAVPSTRGRLSRAPPALSHAPTGSDTLEKCTAAPGPRSGDVGLRLYLGGGGGSGRRCWDRAYSQKPLVPSFLPSPPPHPNS